MVLFGERAFLPSGAFVTGIFMKIAGGTMKRIFCVFIMAFIVLFFGARLNAAPIDGMKQALENTMTGSSFTIEGWQRSGTEEIKISTVIYSKDLSCFRADLTLKGGKMRFVLNGRECWVYIEEKNTIMPLPASEVEGMSPAGAFLKLAGMDARESSEGGAKVFSFTDRAAGTRIVYGVNGVPPVIRRETRFDAKNLKTGELEYKNFKKEKLDENLFKKPAGARDASVEDVASPEAPEKK